LKDIWKKTFIQFIGIILSGLILFLIFQQKDILELNSNIAAYFKWFFGFIIGDYGNSPNTDKMIIFSFYQNGSNYINLSPYYFHSILITLSALCVTFIVSLILNIAETIFTFNKLKWIKEILEWISGIHIIIFSIIIWLFFNHQIDPIIGILMVAFCSNAFFDLSSIQFNALTVLSKKDFIIAARSWGDNVWKHMRRTLAIDTINQFSSMWLIIFTNTLIYEIICQKPGLGYLLWFYFLEPDNRILKFELDLFMTLSMFIIITLFIINFFRDLLLKYLVFIRR